MKTASTISTSDCSQPTFEVFVNSEIAQPQPGTEAETSETEASETELSVAEAPENQTEVAGTVAPEAGNAVDELSEDEIAAFEAALVERCPYTGRVRPLVTSTETQELQGAPEDVIVEETASNERPAEESEPKLSDLAKPRLKEPEVRLPAHLPQAGGRTGRARKLVVPVVVAASFVVIVIAVAGFRARGTGEAEPKKQAMAEPSPTPAAIVTSTSDIGAEKMPAEEEPALRPVSPTKIVDRTHFGGAARIAEEKQPVAPAELGKADSPKPTAMLAEEPQAVIPGAQQEDLAEYDALITRVKKIGGRVKKMVLLREALAVYPHGDDALAQLAILLMDGKKTRNEALGLAERAAQINPDNARAWLAIGYINQLEFKKQESLNAYERCATTSGPKLYVNECRTLLPKVRLLR